MFGNPGISSGYFCVVFKDNFGQEHVCGHEDIRKNIPLCQGFDIFIGNLPEGFLQPILSRIILFGYQDTIKIFLFVKDSIYS